MESVVDSDEEEDLSETSLIVRDAVRECLEKDPSDRRDEDVDILLEFTQHLKAFTNMTMSVRRYEAKAKTHRKTKYFFPRRSWRLSTRYFETWMKKIPLPFLLCFFFKLTLLLRGILFSSLLKR